MLKLQSGRGRKVAIPEPLDTPTSARLVEENMAILTHLGCDLQNRRITLIFKKGVKLGPNSFHITSDVTIRIDLSPETPIRAADGPAPTERVLMRDLFTELVSGDVGNISVKNILALVKQYGLLKDLDPTP